MIFNVNSVLSRDMLRAPCENCMADRPITCGQSNEKRFRLLYLLS